ncbi:Concanavalin A-like lectin/glucanases superfamily protein [uncultured archaeon]|nr:Concanavalin A-like lectin/glucanases superfamily protein [uncultured archaeon]
MLSGIWQLSYGKHKVKITNGIADVTQNVVAEVSKDGLVGYWSFDEGTGSTAYDGSGKGNTGTLKNLTAATCFINNACPYWTSGKISGALGFDGIGDYVEVPSSAVGTTNQMTISLWVNPGIQLLGAYSDSKDIIRSQCYGGGLWSISTAPGFNTNNQLMMQIGWIPGADSWWSPANAVAVKNQWNHLVLSLNRDTGKADFYSNGQFIAETTQTVGIKPITTGFHIGSDCAGPFNGIIDDVKIYNKALTPDDTINLRPA